MDNLFQEIASEEQVGEAMLRSNFALGKVAILKASPSGRAVAVGENLRVKVNANLGTSGDLHDEKVEIRKLEAAVKAGTDTIMDLSTGGNLRSIRHELIANSPVPVGSVPIYEAIVRAMGKGGTETMRPEEMLDAIRLHGEDGISFVTIHCGVTRSALEQLNQKTPGLRYCEPWRQLPGALDAGQQSGKSPV